MTAKQFEDLTVWKEARVLVKSIYLATKDGSISKDFGFKDQIQRAAVSVMNNISEGFERNNNKEFIRFLSYAKGSAGEVRSMLYIAMDLGYIDKSQFENLLEQSLSLLSRYQNLKNI